MAHRRAPNPGILELRDQLLVQLVTEVLDAGGLVVQHHGRRVVGDLALGLGVDADHLGVVPDRVQQLLQVPLVAAGAE